MLCENNGRYTETETGLIRDPYGKIYRTSLFGGGVRLGSENYIFSHIDHNESNNEEKVMWQPHQSILETERAKELKKLELNDLLLVFFKLYEIDHCIELPENSTFYRFNKGCNKISHVKAGDFFTTRYLHDSYGQMLSCMCKEIGARAHEGEAYYTNPHLVTYQLWNKETEDKDIFIAYCVCKEEINNQKAKDNGSDGGLLKVMKSIDSKLDFIIDNIKNKEENDIRDLLKNAIKIMK